MDIQEKKQALIAVDAWRNTSFNPEKRAIIFADDFEKMNNKIKAICSQYGIDSDKFEEKFFTLAMNYLNSESRCVSWAIAGPAKFPVAKMEKRTEAAMNHCDKFLNYPDYVEKICKRLQKRSETQDDKKSKWAKEIEACEQLQEKMKAVNKLIRAGKLDEAKELNGEELPTHWNGIVGYAPFELSLNFAKIKRLKGQIKTIEQKRETCGGFTFDGGKVEFDAEEIRWNIFFDDIPNQERREKLKHNGFKWSPRRQAWTRGAKTMSENYLKKYVLEIGD